MSNEKTVSISKNMKVCGQNIQNIGIPYTMSFDLVAQENSIDGLTGPVYSLIHNTSGLTGEISWQEIY